MATHTFCARRLSNIALAAAALALAPLADGILGAAAYGQLYPMTTFGSNGWVSPASQAVLATANANRGMAWNPVTKNLVVPANIAGNPVTIFNGTTGLVVKTMTTATISGGAVAMSQVGVTDDGQIFVSNIQTSSSLLSFYKVYGWPSESSTSDPNVSLNMNIPAASSGGTIRLGDAFAVTGTGNNVRFAAAGSTSTGTTGGVINNSNFFTGIIDTVSTNSGTYTGFLGIPATNTANNDYRLALTFVDSDTLIGNQGASAKITDFVVSGTGVTGSGATVSGSIPLGAAQRGMDYAVIGGKPYLAVLDTNSSLVTVFDVSNPANPFSYGSLTTIVGASVANANASSQVAWGDITNLGGGFYQAQLYAMNTNNGLQAFNVVVPEPSTWALVATAGLGACSGALVRRRRRLSRATT